MLFQWSGFDSWLQRKKKAEKKRKSQAKKRGNFARKKVALYYYFSRDCKAWDFMVVNHGIS